MRYVWLILCLGLSLSAYGQSSALRSKDRGALRLYEKGMRAHRGRDFAKACAYWQRALARDSGFVNAHWALGDVYGVLMEEEKVLYHWEKALEVAPYYGRNRRLHGSLAEKYYARGEYTKAQRRLRYQQRISYTKDYSDLASRIAYGKRSRAHPHKEVPVRLESPLNGYAAQYFPSLTLDGLRMYFTVRQTPQSDEDFYWTMRDSKDTPWLYPRPLAGLNTAYNEGTGSVSGNGRVLVFSTCQRPDSRGSCDIYVSRMNARDGKWGPSEPLRGRINSSQWESQPCISADGRSLYFASDRPGGYGARDIWVSRWHNGSWGTPENLGPAVNTAGDELSPFIHANQQTLYFASNGHIGMGGWDLFVAHARTEKTSKGRDSTYWTKAHNIGYPLNDHHDQIALFVSPQSPIAYYTYEYINKDKRRVSELYQTTLPKSARPIKTSLLIGKVLDKGGEPLAARAQLYRVGQRRPNYQISAEKNGHFAIPVPHNTAYLLHVSHKGYLPYSRNFDPNTTPTKDTLLVVLTPLRVGEETTLPHIYFDFDSHALTSDSKTGLQTAFEFLSAHRALRIEIEGHTDDRGSADYNEALSLRRAQAVKEALVARGIAEKRMAVRGYGSARPLQAGDSERARAKNRRIVFRIR